MLINLMCVIKKCTESLFTGVCSISKQQKPHEGLGNAL